jgi:hypothetical protein
MPTAIFISSSLIMRIRFGFTGLVNIQRQLGNIRRDPPRLVFGEHRAGSKNTPEGGSGAERALLFLPILRKIIEPFAQMLDDAGVLSEYSGRELVFST